MAAPPRPGIPGIAETGTVAVKLGVCAPAEVVVSATLPQSRPTK